VPLLVDGDNLLGTWRGRKRSDAERQRLAVELARYASREGKRLLIVFDGKPAPGMHFGAGVSFSGPGRKADDAILERLRAETDRRGWTVVTSDRSLGDQCRWLGSRVERCDRFRPRLTGATVDEKPERETDIDYWIQEFGDDSLT
jgi:predicted RNA-binding protein with PIN domain